jgi:NADH-quinone oxidoreductase subunit N
LDDDILRALTASYAFIIPEMILATVACVIFLLGTVQAKRSLVAITALVAVLLAGAAHFLGDQNGWTAVASELARPALFNGPVLHDGLAGLVRLIALGGGIVLILFSWHEVPERQAADYFACLLLILAGVSLTGAANDLVVLFLALELISIPTYILLYLPRHDNDAQEAAFKYFLLSVFSSALTLFGFSYLYGLAGTTNLAVLYDTLHRADPRELPAVAHISVIMVVAGLGFRITVVPFHFYAPDVYQGAPTVGAALLAFVPKVAGFAALLRVLGFVTPTGIAPSGAAFPIGMALSTQVPTILWFIAVVTMFLGNLLALLQDNLKRLLAYSSVAHAGYMLVGLAVAPYLRDGRGALGTDGVEAILYYLVAYGAMTVGAFALLAYLDSPQSPVQTLDDLAGLSRSHPILALTMTLFMFSLIGIPLTAGFTGKFMVFFGAMAVTSPQHSTQARVLAVLAMLNAAIGGWYYLRIVAVMYLRNPLRALPARRTAPALAAVTICALLTIGLSVGPGAEWLLQAAREAAGVKSVSPAAGGPAAP